MCTGLPDRLPGVGRIRVKEARVGLSGLPLLSESRNFFWVEKGDENGQKLIFGYYENSINSKDIIKNW